MQAYRSGTTILESGTDQAICRDVDGWWFVNYFQAAVENDRVQGTISNAIRRAFSNRSPTRLATTCCQSSAGPAAITTGFAIGIATTHATPTVIESDASTNNRRSTVFATLSEVAKPISKHSHQQL